MPSKQKTSIGPSKEPRAFDYLCRDARGYSKVIELFCYQGLVPSRRLRERGAHDGAGVFLREDGDNFRQ